MATKSVPQQLSLLSPASSAAQLRKDALSRARVQRQIASIRCRFESRRVAALEAERALVALESPTRLAYLSLSALADGESALTESQNPIAGSNAITANDVVVMPLSK